MSNPRICAFVLILHSPYFPNGLAGQVMRQKGMYLTSWPWQIAGLSDRLIGLADALVQETFSPAFGCSKNISPRKSPSATFSLAQCLISHVTQVSIEGGLVAEPAGHYRLRAHEKKKNP